MPPIVAARVIASPQAETPSASDALICQMTSHDKAARPEQSASNLIRKADEEGMLQTIEIYTASNITACS